MHVHLSLPNLSETRWTAILSHLHKREVERVGFTAPATKKPRDPMA